MKYNPLTLSTIVAVCAIIAVSATIQLLTSSSPTASARAEAPKPAHVFESYTFTNPFAPTTQEIAAGPTTQDLRYAPTTRPGLPEAQHPDEPTTANTDTGKSPLEWQRLTDDWGGLRPKLEDRGVTFDGSLASYFGKNLTGGASTGKNGGAYVFNLNVTLDSKKIAGYDGGTFFLNFRTQNGLHHSLDGSLETTSHLYSAARTEISEAWYEQKALDDKLRVRLGKIDANTEFDSNSNGAEFLNAFGGGSPTLLSFPTDPDPAFGIDAFVYPTSNLYAGVGVYDGSLQEGRLTGLLGPAKALHPHSEFMIAEVGGTWTAPGGRDGKLGIGIWHHTAEFANFDGGKQSGSTGPYLSLDQTLWRANPDVDGDTKGIALFGNAGYADPSVSQVNYQMAGGVKWTGLFKIRPEDILGLGAGYNRLSPATGAGFDRLDETTIETFYKLRMNAWLSVQPDIQYIHNPGGVSVHHDAVAFTAQALVDF